MLNILRWMKPSLRNAHGAQRGQGRDRASPILRILMQKRPPVLARTPLSGAIAFLLTLRYTVGVIEEIVPKIE